MEVEIDNFCAHPAKLYLLPLQTRRMPKWSDDNCWQYTKVKAFKLVRLKNFCIAGCATMWDDQLV